MAPEKERVKNTPQNIRFFHPGSKTAENHIVPVSILRPAMKKIQDLKNLNFRFCLVASFSSRCTTIEKYADNSGKQDSTADHQNSKTVR